MRSGDLADGSPSVWYRGKAWYGVFSLRSQLFVKVGARPSVPYGIDANVSDILMVNPAGVIDVFSLYTYSTSRLDVL